MSKSIKIAENNFVFDIELNRNEKKRNNVIKKGNY